MQLREKKDVKPTDELIPTRSQKRKNRKNQVPQEQEIDSRKEDRLSNSQSQTPHRTPSKDVTPSKEANENSFNITEIRMLENIPKKSGEYLVQYDSGSMKILRTVELIISNPFEFAEYLERKHKV